MIESPKGQDLPIEISVIVSKRGDQSCPMIVLRRDTQNTDIIKLIISAAFHNRPLIVLPKFTKPLQSLRTLIDNGIIYQEDGQYFFTI